MKTVDAYVAAMIACGGKTETPLDKERLASEAREMSKEVCKKNGHDFPPGRVLGVFCDRCGISVEASRDRK